MLYITKTDKLVLCISLFIILTLFSKNIMSDLYGKILIALISAPFGALFAIFGKHYYDKKQELKRLNILKQNLIQLTDEIILINLEERKKEITTLLNANSEQLEEGGFYFTDQIAIGSNLQSIFKEYDLIKIFKYCKNPAYNNSFSMFYKSTYDLDILYKNSPRKLFEDFINEFENIINGKYNHLFDPLEFESNIEELHLKNEEFLKEKLRIEEIHSITAISFFSNLSAELKTITIK